MRIKQKKQMLIIAQAYRRFCDKIIDALQKQNQVLVINCLEQAQESAIEWGETIEQIESQAGGFIAVLEKLCELYYEISQSVAICETSDQWGKLFAQTSQQLQTLFDEMDEAIQQIPVSYEFVFMPYKVSMWDCMESVYLAAAQDPNCRAIVVPIPYYNIEEDGKRKISNYEGNQMPENISVTHYQDYDISEHMPDAVFIHNPYDEFNLITSVYPEYYSRNLKQYTDQLVYIPYYSTTGIVPEMHRSLAVHRYMDKMVLQSPGEEKFFEGDMFEGKFLSLGSPKFDRIISYEKNKPECPIEWKDILSGRKVFFYNTSISALLNDTENALAKMEYVFSCFMGREDIALIWRPHPLLETTLRSLRMQDYMRFQNLKQKFLESGVGIYDETADINRTIALSDVYIGDMGSSVVNMFGVAGKPIFLLSNGLNKQLTEEELQDSSFTNIIEIDGKHWTFLHKFNALCNIDMDTGRLHLVTSIPYEPVTRGGLVSAICWTWWLEGKNDIILSPNLMDRIVIYHIDTEEFEYELLPDALHNGNLGGFIKWKERDNYLILPNRYPAIVEYDAKTKQFLYHREVMEAIKDYGPEHKARRGYLSGCALLEEQGLLLISLARTNKIIVWDLDKRTYQLVSIGASDKTYGQLFPYHDGVLIREFEGTDMLYWDMKKGSIEEVKVELPEGFTSRRTPFNDDYPLGGFGWYKDNYLIFPQLGNQILELHKEDFSIRRYPIDISKHIREPQTGVFDNRWSNLRGIYAYTSDFEKAIKHEISDFWIRFSADGIMMHVDLDTNETREIKPYLDKDEVAGFISVDKIFCQVDIAVPYAARESEYVTLEKFIDAFLDGKLNNNREEQLKAYGKTAVNLDGTCGQKVYEAVRDVVISGDKI